MKKTKSLLRQSLLWAVLLTGVFTAKAQTTVLSEDFSGATNIFGVTKTELAEGSASVYDTGLSGFGKVLAVCKATAEGTINDGSSQPVAIDGKVTVEWDAFHGYLSGSLSTTVSLLNSDGAELISYVYSAGSCQVSKVAIGGTDVVGFQAFGLQNQNGFGGQKPYGTTGNPHISILMTRLGGVTIEFKKNGSVVKQVLGSLGSLKKDIAKMKIVSTVNNTDRCYAVDNIKVTTEEMVVDPDYIEPIADVTIIGAEKMQFGESTAVAYNNAYSVAITGKDGTLITEDNINEKVTDFKVTWDIEGFKTVNDTEGQYCDSYGSFSVNGQGKVGTTFDLREVPMNFFGKMTATIIYNGTETKAEKYVIAQGDMTKPSNRILPWAGYPVNFSDYPDALVGYKVTGETYGNADDMILGGWSVAGSDSHNGVLRADNDGTKYVRLTAGTLKKSHVLVQSVATPTAQYTIVNKMRFNNAGAVITLTSGYPFWSSSSSYSCPVTLKFDGTSISLNGTVATKDNAKAQINTGAWYKVVLAVDKTTETSYAKIYNANGQLVGETAVVAWSATSSPTYFSIGMDNSNTGSVDLASCEVYQPIADTDSYTLTADKTTLSIPQKESARLSASISDANGYPIIQKATWSVLEEDMVPCVEITPDATDSHQATLTLTQAAEAGTATVQVNIGGNTKNLAIALTSSTESIKFTQSTTSITIPMDAAETATATFAAIVVDGEGNDMGSNVTLAAYDKDNTLPYTFGEGITFDVTTGVLSVKSTASPAQFTIRATGKNSDNEELSKSVRVNVHGMKFDFGFTDDSSVAEGFTAVGKNTTYTAVSGYGLASGSPVEGGTGSADADTDYLEGDMQFNFKAQKGDFYSVEITYQGVLTTGHVNSDLAGYQLGSQSTMTTATYTIPATLDVIDLRIAAVDATHVARIAKISITKQAKRQKRAKRVVHHIGDSTSANNGSWAYRLAGLSGTYPELFELCTFQNNGAGGRNLCTYYTQGRLASVLNDIYPGDVVMFGNNGTNGMGNSFETDMNYYLDAAEALGAKIIINSYTPHGAVSNYAGGYNSSTNTFDSYRRDSYETIVRKVAAQRETSDDNYLGFVEIGMNADAAFNAYVADYAANGYASKDAAAQAIIACFTDHNHYSNGTLACDLMLNGYGEVKGIVAQLVEILGQVRDVTLSETEDNASTLSALDAEKANVTLTRTLYTGGYNTFAVPFALNSLTGTALEGATVKQLESSSLSVDGTLTLTFANATAIEAGRPYLVKVSADVENPTFEGVTVSSAAQTTVTNNVDFVPTLGKTLVSGAAGSENNAESVLFLAAENKLIHPTVVNNPAQDDSYIKGFRAYFQLKGEGAQARLFRLDFGNGEVVTAILGVKAEGNSRNADVYTLDGRKLQSLPTAKGVYVVNGKKVVIK